MNLYYLTRIDLLGTRLQWRYLGKNMLKIVPWSERLLISLPVCLSLTFSFYFSSLYCSPTLSHNMCLSFFSQYLFLDCVLSFYLSFSFAPFNSFVFFFLSHSLSVFLFFYHYVSLSLSLSTLYSSDSSLFDFFSLSRFLSLSLLFLFFSIFCSVSSISFALILLQIPLPFSLTHLFSRFIFLSLFLLISLALFFL